MSGVGIVDLKVVDLRKSLAGAHATLLETGKMSIMDITYDVHDNVEATVRAR